MGLFKNRKKQYEFTGVTGTATRAVILGVHGPFPEIHLTFKVKKTKHDPEEILIVQMSLEEGLEFGRRLLNTLEVATPRLPRRATDPMFGDGQYSGL